MRNTSEGGRDLGSENRVETKDGIFNIVEPGQNSDEVEKALRNSEAVFMQVVIEKDDFDDSKLGSQTVLEKMKIQVPNFDAIVQHCKIHKKQIFVDYLDADFSLKNQRHLKKNILRKIEALFGGAFILNNAALKIIGPSDGETESRRNFLTKGSAALGGLLLAPYLSRASKDKFSNPVTAGINKVVSYPHPELSARRVEPNLHLLTKKAEYIARLEKKHGNKFVTALISPLKGAKSSFLTDEQQRMRMIEKQYGENMDMQAFIVRIKFPEGNGPPKAETFEDSSFRSKGFSSTSQRKAPLG